MAPTSYVALGLVMAAVLVFETTLMRLLSLTLWYPLAYLVLATAMLGTGAAAIALALSRRLAALAPSSLLHRCTVALGLSMALGYPTWNALPLAPLNAVHDPTQLVWLALLVAIVALPFASAGLFVSRTLATWPRHAASIVAVDLAGAAFGVLLVVILLPRFGAPGLVLLAAAIALLAAIATSPPALARRALLSLAVAGCLWLVPHIERLVPPHITPNKLLGSDTARGLTRGTRWSLSSAVDVIADKNGALLVLDGGSAISFVPRLQHGLGKPSDYGVRGLAYDLRQVDSTLVLGSGGGVEVAAALAAGATRVLALEVDPVVNELVRTRLARRLGGLFARPEVQLVTAEARSYLAAHHERFDIIAGFHTISNSASASGALSLAENYLLTVEALRLLLHRLNHGGLLVLSRPEAQVGRLLATVAAAWSHTQPLSQCVAILTEGRDRPAFIAAVLVSPTGFTPEELTRLRGETPGRVAYLPGGGGDTQHYFAAVLGHDNGARAQTLAGALPYRPAVLAPATDLRPFFNMARPWHELRLADAAAVFGSGRDARARLEDSPVAQIALWVLLGETLLFGLGLIVPALRVLVRRGTPLKPLAGLSAFCAALGFSFMVLEVVLMQSFTRLVGEPGWALVAVLAPLLLASSVGSLWLAGGGLLSPKLGAALAAAGGLLVAVVLPHVIDAAAPLEFSARLGVGLATVLVVGVPLGVPFAATLRRLSDPTLVAWAWAVNSVAAVTGSLIALVLSSAWGLDVAAGVAALVYALAAITPARLAPRTSVV